MDTVVPRAPASSESARPGGQESRVLTPEKLQAILASAQKLSDDPLFEEWVQEVEAFRRENI